MRALRFIALSEEGTHLVLAPDVPEAIDNGERFLLPVDERLRAAARGDMSRLGQIELELESTLRPRDIQARIRAGETPEQVAAIAGIRVEKVLRFAHPVLQERERLAGQARQARVRLADGTPAGMLGEFMTEKLSLLDVDHRLAIWDARRLPDGGWEVMVSWTVGNRHGRTRWWYDVTARTVTPADADTSAFAERPRAGQSMIVGPPVESAQRPLSALGGIPREHNPQAADPRGTVQTDDRRTVEEALPPEPGPAPPVSDDDREHRARIPSWEDIVFGVRRKR
ncbi:MAG: DUF3071 domain-containing protein [Geodermatophilaceae bacterium]|nr:DUF3071 domain-containing protein [Geodermatophilaceae bacterium]MDQ3454054.1 septation protein SepH [Actinomycetota bacterium]